MICLLSRRALGLAAAAALAVGFGAGEARAEQTLRIGYQKYGTLLLLKGKGTLEARLKEQGVAVKWAEFPAGPQLLEALNAGAIDFGTAGEAPPIFAQVASAKLAYVAHEPPAPKGEAILVPKTSTIQSVAELKGKKVAFNKGSNVHYLLVRALEKAGVAYSEITPIFLPPSDARAAFERGSVDAWAIWDPFLAAAEAATGARALANGEGIVSNHQFFLASRPYAEANKAILNTLLDELRKVEEWAQKDAAAAAAELAPSVGIPAPILEVALKRQAFGVRPISPDVAAAQQRIADVFLELKLLPKPIVITDAVLSLETAEAAQ
jgi:sulfonate transport system substrate-binding protein